MTGAVGMPAPNPIGSIHTVRPRHGGWPSPHVALGNLSLARKVALIPALTLLLLCLMLVVGMRMGERNTDALRALDVDVFEPLNRAQTLKDQITLLHTRLFALLSIGNNENDPEAQQAHAETLLQQARNRRGALQPLP